MARYNAAHKFSEFCAGRCVHDLTHVKPVHVSAYIESLLRGFAKSTIKQHLAAIRMLFDWLVVGHINGARALTAKKYPADELKKLRKGADEALFEKLRNEISENDGGEDGDE